KDTIQAIKYYEQACHVEEPYGCYNARYFYLHGLGVMQDDVLAAFAEKAKAVSFLLLPSVML
ncbi:hypothetical protein MJN54_34130, partial [Salmonella enterica subsp. enterica serovar Kentucky]|nr:hypothetical protein [Salmonella enterica subsp. enterica serovar Kentucky]